MCTMPSAPGSGLGAGVHCTYCAGLRRGICTGGKDRAGVCSRLAACALGLELVCTVPTALACMVAFVQVRGTMMAISAADMTQG